MNGWPAGSAGFHGDVRYVPLSGAAGVLASAVSQNATRILLACGFLLAALIVLGVGLWYYRRHWIVDSQAGAVPWTFDEIRGLRDRGEITEAEYQALRAQLLGMSHPDAAPSQAAASQTVKPSGADPSGETVWRFDLKKTPPG